MNAALVPVRSVCGAKNRLASTLDVERRRSLALAMLADMLGALAVVPSLDKTVVVSADAQLLEHAAALGADTIDEGEPRGLNAAVAMAASLLEARGIRRLLTIPGDVPLLEAGEVERILTTDPARYPVVLVPSASGTGTNGLLASPPTVIRPCFEGASLEAYRQACREAGIDALVLPLAGFALDVDTARDLEVLAAQGNGQRSVRVAADAMHWKAVDSNPSHERAPATTRDEALPG